MSFFRASLAVAKPLARVSFSFLPWLASRGMVPRVQRLGRRPIGLWPPRRTVASATRLPSLCSDGKCSHPLATVVGSLSAFAALRRCPWPPDESSLVLPPSSPLFRLSPGRVHRRPRRSLVQDRRRLRSGCRLHPPRSVSPSRSRAASLSAQHELAGLNSPRGSRLCPGRARLPSRR